MRTPSPRARKNAAPVAVLVAGVMVWQGSTAAFTAATRHPAAPGPPARSP